VSVERETPLQAGEGFQERLKRLRIKLDLLPEGQRPHLIDLAETIARQHQQLQNRVSQTRDAD
jgi:hypothetical protein